MANRNRTRIFNLTWDNSKFPAKDPEDRYRRRDCEGVHFANGMIVLDIGVVWTTKSEMDHHLSKHGSHTLTYQDEEGPVEQQQSA